MSGPSATSITVTLRKGKSNGQGATMSWPVTRLPVDFNLIYRFTTRCFRYVALHLLYQLSYIQTPLLGGSCQLTIAPLETRKILMTLPCLLLMSYLGGSPETTRRVLASIVHEAVAVSILTVLLSFACQATSPSSSRSVRRDREPFRQCYRQLCLCSFDGPKLPV